LAATLAPTKTGVLACAATKFPPYFVLRNRAVLQHQNMTLLISFNNKIVTNDAIIWKRHR
jgi:hypothetical protein